ncbi:hypothetical protein UA08_03643 [Talaromyces atroroseus]|uniref:Zn(2)-C6 fungal-type domain-containing protein n=1 Tax=Talaromyces atroroseus TaxID=1441469 RepID=A0A225AHR8_TALAT|nr:hypothetical protein UA08_03643 [Talaromyces atroroseus]OKL60992.1 hypothetical protein UA08_03643 [Talaromyces atroroseus]
MISRDPAARPITRRLRRPPMSSYHSRAKTKTFTGCWTCRERKVKCDEGRPSCQQCIGRDLECKGYAQRLQWLAPLTATGGGCKVPTACDSVGLGISHRRIMFCDRKLDALLHQIDSSGLLTAACGPFSVFPATEACLHESAPTSCAFDDALIDDDLLQYAGRSPELASPANNFVVEPWSWRGSESPAESLVTASSPGDTTDITSISPSPTPLTPSRVPAHVEWLLHHYKTDIVDLMTAVTTPKGPWKTVHLPRALQGCGELAFRGTTSHARNALLHALLTISAYNLAANGHGQGQALDAHSWREVALKHTAQSLTYLKSCLQPGCPVSERGKYKEVLAAMLSMITIEVCSGDTSSSKWHLKGIEDFIHTTQRKPGRRYSRKAQSLHRDYVYLRIMREATDLQCAALDADLGPCSEATTAWLCRPLYFLDSLNVPDMWLQDSGPGDSIDHSACEFVYGVPLELLVLASKTSELIRRKRTFARHHPGSVAPAPFLSMCDDLELQILKWPVDRMVENIAQLPIAEESQRLITHQTRAFLQAVIIYFSRLVRGVHRRHLQPYAESIIDHLETVERIKCEANLTTGCISWPWFVGAAETMTEDLRGRYLQWSRSIRFYKLGAYDKATLVISKVWERDKTDKGLAPVCDWPTILEAEDISLMLM